MKVAPRHLLAALVGLTTMTAGAQTTTTQTAPITVRGQVTNALTGAGIPRALVTVGSRRVLTDAQGAFQLVQFTDSANSGVQVQKPGFSTTLYQQDQVNSSLYDLTQPVALRLYPDGVLTGTVNGPDGEPLGHLSLRADRAQFDATGYYARAAATATTDSHGQYRFRLPPGQYRLLLQFTPRLDGGTKAVLPEAFPVDPSSRNMAFLRLNAGEQKVIDLRPSVGPTHSVLLKPDGADGQFGVMTATNARGDVFQLPTQIKDGEAKIELPAGTYQLRAMIMMQEQVSEGNAKVTVANSDLSGIPIHMGPAAVLPVEVIPDLSTAGTSVAQAAPQIPNAQQLNLYLRAQTASDAYTQDVRIETRGTGPSEFHAPAGRYRLHGFANGTWAVESATCGQTNLLTSELVIAAGSGGSTVRVVVTNRAGRISGTVQPAANDPSGTVPQGWVYLVAEFPALTPFRKVRIGRSGTYQASMVPGHYFAVAVPHSLEVDLTDSDVIARFGRLGKQFEITDAGQATVDLALTSPDAKETQ